MVRLRKTFPGEPGWTRQRQGTGFSYRDGDRLLDGAERARCEALVIPPAWIDVWISPVSNGHIQAVGTDNEGRRQYLYHPDWRERRDREKFDALGDFADHLPQARRTVRRHIKDVEPTVRKMSALAFRLLDVGAFRIGSPRYTEDNGSYGLLTLECHHVKLESDCAEFTFPAKSGLTREFDTNDGLLIDTLGHVMSAKSRHAKILDYREDGEWLNLSSEQFSAYLKTRLGNEATAKQFRTWRANVVAAAALALGQQTEIKPSQVVRESLDVVAEHLGNTPAIAKSSYVDPRLIDLFNEGITIDPALAKRCFPKVGHQLSPRLESATTALLDV